MFKFLSRQGSAIPKFNKETIQENRFNLILLHLILTLLCKHNFFRLIAPILRKNAKVFLKLNQL